MASLRRDKRVKFDDRTPLGAEEESVSTALSKLSDANSATGIESCGEMILEAIAKAKTRRETRSSQEIHSSMVDLERALAERDRALKQVDTLEDENDYLRGRVEHLQQENALSDQFMVQSLQVCDHDLAHWRAQISTVGEGESYLHGRPRTVRKRAATHVSSSETAGEK
eukprot:m.35679 g.35679  ORF g.35679 m.35679 type:complete len:169 (+) comp32165_c0_seq1:81-587(+)